MLIGIDLSLRNQLDLVRLFDVSPLQPSVQHFGHDFTVEIAKTYRF